MEKIPYELKLNCLIIIISFCSKGILKKEMLLIQSMRPSSYIIALLLELQGFYVKCNN